MEITNLPSNEIKQITESIVIRFNFIESCLERIYLKNGFISIPLNNEHVEFILKTCSRDIYYFFAYVFSTTSEAHKMLDLFIKCQANLYVFYTLLSEQNQHKLMSFDMFDLSKKI